MRNDRKEEGGRCKRVCERKEEDLNEERRKKVRTGRRRGEYIKRRVREERSKGLEI